MANEQINVPSLLVILVLSGLIIRYLFFSTSGGQRGGNQHGQGQRSRDAAALRAREAAAERIVQMFPQVDRRTALWDLQRTGGNIQATSERVLAGRLETPPISFQPPPPPGSVSASASSSSLSQAKPVEKPSQPDLITRYRLQGKVETSASEETTTTATTMSTTSAGKAWSSNRDERQSLLQKRRDEMILAARRKMEAKIAAEKAAATGISAS